MRRRVVRSCAELTECRCPLPDDSSGTPSVKTERAAKFGAFSAQGDHHRYKDHRYKAMIRPMKKTSQKASKKILGDRWKLLSEAEEDREVLIQCLPSPLPPTVLD